MNLEPWEPSPDLFLDAVDLLMNTDVGEAVTDRLTTWLQTTLDDGTVNLLTVAHVDGKHTEAGRVAPYVGEGQDSELEAPHTRSRQPTQQRHEAVAASVAAGVAAVGELPHAVYGVGAVRFCKDLIKRHLADKGKRAGRLGLWVVSGLLFVVCI